MSLFLKRMVMTKIFLYIVLGHLFVAHVSSECLAVECLKCNTTEETPECPLCAINGSSCINVPSNISSQCKKDFQVFINRTGSVDEGKAITLKCVHDLQGQVTFEWAKEGNVLKDQNESELALEKVLSSHLGPYGCRVYSSCGNYTSSPHSVKVSNNSVVILVICGVSALAMVVIMGLAMKFKLKRDNIKSRERMNRTRAQVGQSGPTPITPREA
ncbi:uncharacterized protein LOC121611921 isoform X2 [Scomber scombrus]|uniref:Uncharacterized protein LOC121611921 isoform X2 n=1 Tax=Scomber scombrus TaxID=13677 RepID=A0AAV1NAF7_SCOSC